MYKDLKAYMIVDQVTDIAATQQIFRFENGYGASVIRGPYTYGGDEGLYELAVVRFDKDSDEFNLTYETPITDDVLGYLSEEDVYSTLQKIKDLE